MQSRIGHGDGRRDEESWMPIDKGGAGLLWFGWFGFNAGSALEVAEPTMEPVLGADG